MVFRTEKLSLFFLLTANLVPLVGVMWLGWDLFTILLLYWLESLVVGLFNALRMIKINPRGSFFYVPFFSFHFGMFMFVHLVFIVTFFGQNRSQLNIASVLPVALLALFISHGVSYATNFIGRREFEKRTIKEQLFAPYGRVVVMHLTVLFGGWLVILLNAPTIALVIMVAVKTVVDAIAHIKSHSK